MGVVDLWVIGNEDKICLKIALSLGRSFASVGPWVLMALLAWVIGRDHERPGF